MRRSSSPVCSRSAWLMPATGSSSSSSRASCTSSMPISSHCFCPCASIPAGESRRSARPIVSSAASTSAGTPVRRRSSASGPRPAPAAMSRFCSTVSSSKTLAVWNVRPTPARAIRCAFRPSSSTPPKRAEPVAAVEAGDRVDDRRLAGAVGADEEPQVAAGHREVDAVDGDEAVEVDPQAADLEVVVREPGVRRRLPGRDEGGGGRSGRSRGPPGGFERRTGREARRRPRPSPGRTRRRPREPARHDAGPARHAARRARRARPAGTRRRG